MIHQLQGVTLKAYGDSPQNIQVQMLTFRYSTEDCENIDKLCHVSPCRFCCRIVLIKKIPIVCSQLFSQFFFDVKTSTITNVNTLQWLYQRIYIWWCYLFITSNHATECFMSHQSVEKSIAWEYWMAVDYFSATVHNTNTYWCCGLYSTDVVFPVQ